MKMNKITHEIIARAKNIRNAAAQKFGGKPEDFLWSECLKMALKNEDVVIMDMNQDEKDIISYVKNTPLLQEEGELFYGEFEVKSETKKAILVSDCWLPKSQINFIWLKSSNWTTIMLAIPDWLLRQNQNLKSKIIGSVKK